MPEPNYVFKDYEAILVPKNKSTVLSKIKVAVWIIAAVIIVASFIF